MKAALEHASRVISTAQVVLLGQSAGSVRGLAIEDQGAVFVYASHEPPPACVRCAGVRASGKVSGRDGAFAGW